MAVWQVNDDIFFSPAVRENREAFKFAKNMIKQLAGSQDPRCFSSPDGFVKPGENHAYAGGQNLRGAYIFKPTCLHKQNGRNIRIVFRLYCNGRQVMPGDELRGRPRQMNVQNVGFRYEVYMGDEVQNA